MSSHAPLTIRRADDVDAAGLEVREGSLPLHLHGSVQTIFAARRGSGARLRGPTHLREVASQRRHPHAAWDGRRRQLPRLLLAVREHEHLAAAGRLSRGPRGFQGGAAGTGDDSSEGSVAPVVPVVAEVGGEDDGCGQLGRAFTNLEGEDVEAGVGYATALYIPVAPTPFRATVGNTPQLWL